MRKESPMWYIGYGEGFADGVTMAKELVKKFLTSDPSVADTIAAALEKLEPDVRMTQRE